MADDAFARIHACSPRTTSLAAISAISAIEFPMKNFRMQCIDSHSCH